MKSYKVIREYDEEYEWYSILVRYKSFLPTALPLICVPDFMSKYIGWVVWRRLKSFSTKKEAVDLCTHLNKFRDSNVQYEDVGRK